MDLFDFIFIKACKPGFFMSKNPSHLLDLNSPTLKGEEIKEIDDKIKFYFEGNYEMVERYIE